MPTTLTEYAEAAQEQTLKAIRESQEGVVEAVRTWASALEKTAPELPSTPFVDELPNPLEVVQASFGFAEELLKAQREFVESVIAAAAPVLGSKSAATPSKGSAKSA